MDGEPWSLGGQACLGSRKRDAEGRRERGLQDSQRRRPTGRSSGGAAEGRR